MELVEIFESVSGEVGGNIPQGALALFVRFAGCSLKCSWCDAKISWKKAECELSLEELDELLKKNNRTTNLVVTGGEPFEQSDILPFLRIAKKYFRNIAIETSGYKFPEEMTTEFADISLIMDYKPRSAEVEIDRKEINRLDIFKDLADHDVIKFPFCNLTDLQEAVSFAKVLQAHYSETRIENTPIFAFSPIPPKDFSWIADYLLDQKINGVVNIQIHKVLQVR